MKTTPLPVRTNWLKWIFCSHEYASDPLELSKICQKCGWHNNPYLRPFGKLLCRIDKRGRIVGSIVHLKEAP